MTRFLVFALAVLAACRAIAADPEVTGIKGGHRDGQTFVTTVGEFGRTPKVSTPPGEKSPGRDHWVKVHSVLFAGAGE